MARSASGSTTTRIINSALVAGWQTVELTVPTGQLKEGENALSLFFKPGEASIAWMQIGGSTPVADDGDPAVLRSGRQGAGDPEGRRAVVVRDGAADKGQLTGDLDRRQLLDQRCSRPPRTARPPRAS